MFNEKPYVIVIDRGGNLFKIKEKTMQECFDKIIAPLDIISQVGNESEIEIAHEIGLDYVKQLENGLMSANIKKYVIKFSLLRINLLKN